MGKIARDIAVKKGGNLASWISSIIAKILDGTVAPNSLKKLDHMTYALVKHMNITQTGAPLSTST